jgi:hypothetical protein
LIVFAWTWITYLRNKLRFSKAASDVLLLEPLCLVRLYSSAKFDEMGKLRQDSGRLCEYWDKSPIQTL